MSLPGLLLMVFGTMFSVAWVLARWWPPAAAAAPVNSGKFASLDGLRGLLACSVLVHHAEIARHFYAGEPWQSPANALYHFCGDGAVAVFFMITGLLFWDKALDGRLRFEPLIRSRVRRIVPLQLFGLLVVTTISFSRSDASAAAEPIEATLAGVANWLTSGLVGEARINAVPTQTVDAGVTWTLGYEWLFYLALVPLAKALKPPRRFLLFVALAFATAFIARRTGHYMLHARLVQLLPFLGGMATAYLVRRVGSQGATRAACSTAVVVLVCGTVSAYHIGNLGLLNLALVPAFLAIAQGNDIFGLLRRPWLRWLGHISFSVYLLHGIVLLATLRLVNGFVPIATLDDPTYVALIASIAAAVVLIASWTYLMIERTFFDPVPALGWKMRARGARLPLPR